MPKSATFSVTSLLAASICVALLFPADGKAQQASAASPSSVNPADDLQTGLEAYRNFDYAMAAKLLKPLADRGDAQAQYAMAMMYGMGGFGIDVSPMVSFEYAQRAEKQGHLGARMILAGAYLEGIGTNEDGPKGVRLAESVLKAGNATADEKAEAANLLGYAYDEGLGVKASPAKALAYYKQSYQPPHDEYTLRDIVRLLDEGAGGSFEKEVYWYRELAILGDKDAFAKVKAHADEGDARSQYVAGVVYYGDRSLGPSPRDWANIGEVERNGQRTWEYFERSAKGGIGDAAYEAVDLFLSGFPDEERKAKARHWLVTAPTMEFIDPQNLTRAQNRLADAHLSGRLGQIDLVKAADLYRAARNGDGLNEVAKTHIFAKNTPEDIPKGLVLLQEGAALGSAKCQFNLGTMYVFGKGVEPDFDKALGYFDQANANGYTRAKQYADELRSLGKLPEVSPDQLQG